MTAFLIHPKLPTGIKAAIFDADGVLLNTAGIWKGLGDRYLKSLGLVPEEGLGTRLFSMSLEQGADYLRTRYALGNTTEEIIADLETLLHDFYYYEAEAKPGARELAALLADSGVALAVATSSPKDLICSALSRLGLLSYFQQVLTTTE
ncbi:MAG: HAD family phosphatase, partial [Firmicutes bacterium]|nr:HAD family phosphatase [Bacillota bacterium]